MANVAVGLTVLFIAWALGGTPGLGTVANAVLVGTFIQGLLAFDVVVGLQHDALAVRVVLLALGIALIGPATAFYIGADFGAGPRDTLMLVGSRRTGRRVGLVRGTLEVCALVVGIVLGGTFGLGTIAFALLVGPVVEGGFWLLEHSQLAVPEPGAAAVVIGE
jgi:uncharacterized protein